MLAEAVGPSITLSEVCITPCAIAKFPRKTSYDEVKKGYPHSPYIKKYPYPHREYKRVEPTKHYNYYDLYDSPQEYDRGYHQPYDGYPFN